MESGTPGVKVDRGRLSLARARPEKSRRRPRPLRAVSLTPALPRILAGAAGAVAMTNVAQFGIRAGSRDGRRLRFVRVDVRRGRRRNARRHGEGVLRGGSDPQIRRSRRRIAPENGAEYPDQPVRELVEADRAADQVRRRARDRLHGRRRLGHARRRGRSAGPARQPPARLRPGDRRVREGPRLADGRRDARHDVRVRPHSAARTATAAPTTATPTSCSSSAAA